MAIKVIFPHLEGNSRAAVATRVFLNPLLVLARQRKSWSPNLVGGTLWRALTNLSTRQDILRLLELAPFREHAQNNPRFALKYLTRDYMVRDLTVVERAACFVHHHRRLRAALPDWLLRQTLQGDVLLHDIPEGSNRFTLTIGLPRSLDKEGEMSLNLIMDGRIISVLSFAIVPGWVVGAEAAEVLLITHLQGKRGAYSQIYLATKTLYDVAPRAILPAALQGVAIALGIDQMAAVCAVRQTCFSERLAADFKSNYDDFFIELGMARNGAGFFMGPVPLENKPLALIKPGHKIRTIRKRAFKQRIQVACAGFMTDAGCSA